jgi:hypothetical protein
VSLFRQKATSTHADGVFNKRSPAIAHAFWHDGSGFDGALSPGDWVELDQDWKPGTTMHMVATSMLE